MESIRTSCQNFNLYTTEHEQFRDAVKMFVKKEIAPFANEWDEAESFPRDLYCKAGGAGLLGIGYPEEYGGTPTDILYQLILVEELAKAGCGGISASLLSHSIGTPPIAIAGSAAIKERVLPEILSGRKISALAVTEPSGGSDVAALRTTAVSDGDYYVVNGEKTFITSGMRADYYTVAVRTNPEAKGADGISLLLIERDTPGFTRTPLKKMGWWASDTATLHFDNCRVLKKNLLGKENEGFRIIMRNFNTERLSMAAGAYGFAQVCYDEALAWARERKTFGASLSERQVIRHKFVDMKMKIEATRTLLNDSAWKVASQEGDPKQLVAQLCMLKNFSMQTMQFCADEGVQILGGMGFMRGTAVERIYREVKVNMIGGGSVEIMKDLAARQLDI